MKWNNFIAIGILVVAYVISAIRFVSLQMQIRRTNAARDDAERVIRVTHWQLEPGFREAMQWAIDRYNALPHVRAAKVRVEQLAITERVYNQFMNVHLISGTAPDIATLGRTRLIQGNNVARFYTPLGEYVSEPNPYNAREYLAEDLPDALKELLASAPWRDTFIDGMVGGFDSTLNDYYSVPISNFGSLRLFYNRRYLKLVKAFALEALQRLPQPDWVQQLWLRETDAHPKGFLADTPELREWLKDDTPPKSLGKLIFYCEAVLAYARANNLPFLVPISGSNYDASNLALMYKPIFMSHFTEETDLLPGYNMRVVQALAAWEKGRWSFDSPPYREFLEFARHISRYFPRGFLGLDREQAQRRFILGKAAIISSGAWDASGIFKGAATRDREAERFEVVVTPMPMAAPGERWHEYLPMNRSEASFTTGVPLGINQRTPHFRWALDFLKFMSSQPINQEFSQRANWLPAIVGAEPSEFMRPFMPIPEGIPGNISIMLNQAGGGLQNLYTGALKLYMTGDISLEEFRRRVERYLANPRVGLRRLWIRDLQRETDMARARDRSVSLEEFRILFRGDKSARARHKSLYLSSLLSDKGVSTLLLWQRYHGDQPFPTLD